MKDCHTCVCVRRHRRPGQAMVNAETKVVAMAHGRSDHGLNVPFKWLHILPVVRMISHTRCKQHVPVPVPSSTSIERVGEQAFEIIVCRDTLAWVCGRSGFWGAYSRLLASSVRPALLCLHLVLRRLPRATFVAVILPATVRGTALHTSSYIEFVWLHRTYTRYLV
jgi:hypothetical protein